MGLLAEIYSTLDSAKRKAGAAAAGLIDDPGEQLRQWVANNNNDAGQRLKLLESLYLDKAGAPTLNPNAWTPQAAAAQDTLANDAMGAVMGATAWHGSPHVFDKFDSKKIGTGEGKQQQGVGLYLAEAKPVAQKYADRLADMHGKENGNLYKVDFPDDALGRMANYDAALKDQPPSVGSAFNQILDPQTRAALRDYHGWENANDAPVAAIMMAMDTAKGNSRAETSRAMAAAGIPGIRYLDGGSRATGGTSNYVVFPGNEDILKILERNGMPLPPLIGPGR